MNSKNRDHKSCLSARSGVMCILKSVLPVLWVGRVFVRMGGAVTNLELAVLLLFLPVTIPSLKSSSTIHQEFLGF